MGFEENGVLYLYRKNLFGDITAIYQGSTKVAEYEYDAWGNCTITYNTNGIGTRNPFRYRGYYFDTDLNLYYLLTRYYDPKTGRFINADSLEYLDPNKINGLNLYAYCRNNPIMHVDYAGNDAILITAYAKNGLPIVGHTAIAIQDEYGIWYIVEYSGSSKADAKVSVTQVPSDQTVCDFIKSLYGSYSEEDINNKTGINKFKAILSNIFHAGMPYETLYLSGEYYGSLDLATKDIDNNSKGYNLIFNNCVQYINKILKSDKNKTGIMQGYFYISYALVPALFHNRIKRAYGLASALQGMFDFAGSLLGND